MQFHTADVVTCSLVDADGNETRCVGEFIRGADPNETVMYKGRKRDAAWVRLLDGDDEGLTARVPYETVRHLDR